MVIYQQATNNAHFYVVYDHDPFKNSFDIRAPGNRLRPAWTITVSSENWTCVSGLYISPCPEASRADPDHHRRCLQGERQQCAHIAELSLALAHASHFRIPKCGRSAWSFHVPDA